jgi:hypothetical protein
MQRVVKPGGRVAVMVHSTAATNPLFGLTLGIVCRVGNIPTPPLGEPGMFALAGPGVLEETFRKAGLHDVTVHPVAIRRKFSSLAEAIKTMKESFVFLQDILVKLHVAEQDRAWNEIEQEMKQFETENGFEAPGEVLIGVGTK